MTYEVTELSAKIEAQLNVLTDSAKYKAAAKAHMEAISSITPDSYAFGGVEGYAISDYNTWK